MTSLFTRHQLVVLTAAILLPQAAFATSAVGGTALARPLVRSAAFDRHEPAFEANHGQAGRDVDYLSRGVDDVLLVSATSVRSLDREGKVRPGSVHFLGANQDAAPLGLNLLPGRTNYIGGRFSDGAIQAPTYAKASYRDAYAGIDLIHYHRDGRPEFDFVVRPGADPNLIGMTFPGAGAPSLDGDGGIVLDGADGSLTAMRRPVAYQERDGARIPVEVRYVLNGGVARIVLGPYDRTLPVVVDPVVDYVRAFGGERGSAAYAVAVDREGNAYVTGDTMSLDLPLDRGIQRKSAGATDAFVAKLAPDGTVVYATYLAGSDADVGYGIAVDAAGSAYVTGDTRSPDFPVVNAFQPALKGSADVFVAKLSPDGSKLLYSTYVGGEKGQRGQGIAVDIDGRAVVAGYTNSTAFPTEAPVQKDFAGGNADAFIFKLDPSGSRMVYSTYLGGGNDRPDIATAVAVDASGNAYVTGFTNSVDFPTKNPIQKFVGPTDAFITKLNRSGALVYSTHIGGNADDEAMGIAVDADGSAYITGETESLNYPTTPGAFSTKCDPVKVPILKGEICAGGDVFVTKLSPDGDRIVYSTYVNGKDFEVGRAIAVDAAGSAYVTGLTVSTDFPTRNSTQATYGGGRYDAFLFKLDPEGKNMPFATFLGGNDQDGGYGLAVDGKGEVVVAGYTMSRDFGAGIGKPGPTVEAQTTASRRAVVVKYGSTAEAAK